MRRRKGWIGQVQTGERLADIHDNLENRKGAACPLHGALVNSPEATALEGPMFRTAKPIGTLIAVFLVLVCGSVWAQDAPRIGLKIRTLTAELRQQRNLAGDVKGALVTAVDAGSAAHEKGIAVGDIIVEAGGKPIATAKEVASQIAAAAGSHAETILLRVMDSKGDRRDVAVPIPKRSTQGSPLILPGPK